MHMNSYIAGRKGNNSGGEEGLPSVLIDVFKHSVLSKAYLSRSCCLPSKLFLNVAQKKGPRDHTSDIN